MQVELRGGLQAKLLRGGAVRDAGKVTARRGGLRAMTWQNLRCGLTAGQVTAGRGGLRAQISSYCRALVGARTHRHARTSKLCTIMISTMTMRGHMTSQA